MSTSTLGGAKIFGEVRVNLKIKFPTLDNETIEVRAKPHKILSQVVQHILQKLQGACYSPWNFVTFFPDRLSVHTQTLLTFSARSTVESRLRAEIDRESGSDSQSQLEILLPTMTDKARNFEGTKTHKSLVMVHVFRQRYRTDSQSHSALDLSRTVVLD